MEPNNNNDNEQHSRYEPLPPHPHGYHPPPRYADPNHGQPPPQHQQQHGGQPPQHQHEQPHGHHPPPPPPHHHQPYGYPNYGYPAVSYQNYANYPPAPAPPPVTAQQGGGGGATDGSSGGRGRSDSGSGSGQPSSAPQPQQQPTHPAAAHHHQHQPYPYHPPIAYHYDQQAAAAAAAAAYQYPPEQQTGMTGKAATATTGYAKAEYLPYPPPPPTTKTAVGGVDKQYKQSTAIYVAPPGVTTEQIERQPGSPSRNDAQQQFESKQPPDGVEQDEMEPTPAEVVQPALAEMDTGMPTGPVGDTSPMAAANVNQEEIPIIDYPPTADGAQAEEVVADEPTADQQKGEQKQPTFEEIEAGGLAAGGANEEQQTDESDPALEQPPETITDTADTSSKSFPFGVILDTLHKYQSEHPNNTNLSIPMSDPAFMKIVNQLFSPVGLHGMEEVADNLWEDNFELLKEYKERVGDCDVPFTDDILGSWVERQRKLYAQQQESEDDGDGEETSQQQQQLSTTLKAKYTLRFQKLTSLNFDFQTPMWDTRLRELLAYKSQHDHVSPPVDYPKLGIWTINQRFNIKDMPKERVKALDKLGFVWNHNRKNRSQKKWEDKYEELLEYVKVNGHCNVPATFRHSPLGTWVGKQREEYRKLKDKKSSQLDKYRIDKLNEVGFQWSLQSWKIISWNDRFDALKKFKEEQGHVKVPRNHPDFGNWPIYQKAQYKLYKVGKKSKITKEKVDKLIDVGFFENPKSDDDSQSQVNAALDHARARAYDAGITYDWNHPHSV